MTTHSTSPPSGAPKFRAMTGRVMLTIDESIVAMRTPTATIENTVHLLGNDHRGLLRAIANSVVFRRASFLQLRLDDVVRPVGRRRAVLQRERV